MRTAVLLVAVVVFLCVWRLRVLRQRAYMCLLVLDTVDWMRGKNVAICARIPAHAVYPILHKLEDIGMVIAVARDYEGLTPRYYQITDKGRAAIRATASKIGS